MGDFTSLAKTLIGIGLMILLLGLLLLFAGKISGVGKLPGDIYFKKGNFTFYFPLVTSLLLSLFLTLILNLLFRK